MQLVFATNNIHKIKEVQAVLPKDIKLLSLTDIGCFETIPETQNTILGNAVQKATYVTKNYGYNCFADDTGLEVEALNNAPGVYSARYAGAQRNANDNMDKVLEQLKNTSNRNAHFKTVIALITTTTTKTFTGICEGKITTQKRGTNGFGYDPIFIPKGYTQTFAQISLTEKNKIGHRGKAIKKLVAYLKHR